MPSKSQDRTDLEIQAEPRGVEPHIADADEKARDKSGSKEQVRNTPPAGAWNETSHD